MNTFLATIGLIAVVIPLMLLVGISSVMWRAWWLYPAWGWFVVPLGLPQVSFWHFIALLFLVGLITQHTDDKKDDRKTDWSKLLVVFLWPMFAWILLWWMR